MLSSSRISGVFAASITPIKPNGEPDYSALPSYLDFLAQRGCQGALILGTTGEGPSFSVRERKKIYRSALEIRQKYSSFILLAGTGTPSLDETRQLTRYAFEIGMDGVLVLPPYYFRKITDEGLFAWFDQVIQKAVPRSGKLFYYHIPNMTGINLSIEFLHKLHDQYPDQFAGLKDSSSDVDFALRLGEQFGNELCVLTGQDRLFGIALRNHASGCITAGANLFSPWLSQVWEAHQKSTNSDELEKKIQKARLVMDQYSPASALIKAVIPTLFNLPNWQVRPPVLPLDQSQTQEAVQQLSYECGIQST